MINKYTIVSVLLIGLFFISLAGFSYAQTPPIKRPEPYIITKNVFATPKQYTVMSLLHGTTTSIPTTIQGTNFQVILDILADSYGRAYGLGMENGGANGASLEIIDMKNGTIVQKINVSGPITTWATMALSPDGQTITIVGVDSTPGMFIRKFNIATQTLSPPVNIGVLGQSNQSLRTRYSADGTTLFIEALSTIHVVDATTYAIIGNVPKDGFVSEIVGTHNGAMVFLNQTSFGYPIVREVITQPLVYVDTQVGNSGEFIGSATATPDGITVGVVIHGLPGTNSSAEAHFFFNGTKVCTNIGTPFPNGKMTRHIQYDHTTQLFSYIQDSISGGTVFAHNQIKIDALQCTMTAAALPIPTQYVDSAHETNISPDGQFLTYAYVPSLGTSYLHVINLFDQTAYVKTNIPFTGDIRSSIVRP